MMASETSRPVRWLVVCVLTLATLGMFLISMRANYLYGRSIGQSPETKEAIAWANVGADLWKGFGLILVAALWRGGRRRAALATSCTWIVCLFFSVSSAIGIYVQERTALTGGREAKHASYTDAQHELATLEAKRTAIQEPRTPGEVEAAIASLLSHPVVVNDRVRGTVGSLSATCTKVDARTAHVCATVAEEREALARATEAARLDAELVGVRKDVAQLRTTGAAERPDPVGEFWAWITRGFVSVASVGFGLPLAFALMIEMVSAFGPLGIVAYAEATRRSSEPDVAAGRDVSRRVETEHGVPLLEQEAGRVMQFMAERTEPTDRPVAITFDELYAAYAQWCAAGKQQPLSLEAFDAAFERLRAHPELAGRIRKFGARYYGIALVGQNVARLPPRKSG